MKKYTIIVLALFAYAIGMFIWGYTKGTISGTDALIGTGVMSVILIALWFIYRQRERYREKLGRGRK